MQLEIGSLGEKPMVVPVQGGCIRSEEAEPFPSELLL